VWVRAGTGQGLVRAGKKGRVEFSEKAPICTTPAAPSKNYALVFKVAFPKLIAPYLLPPRNTLLILYSPYTLVLARIVTLERYAT
jgi:hypothetical protein